MAGELDLKQYLDNGQPNPNYGKLMKAPEGTTISDRGVVSGRSLEGTLSTDSNETISTESRKLPTGSLSAFQDVLKQISFGAYQKNKPSVSDVINQYAGKGVSLINPETARQAYSQQSDLYKRPIADIYESTMTQMVEKQQQDAEYASMLINSFTQTAPTFLPSLTAEEFMALKSNQMTPEMQIKLKQAQDLAMTTDGQKPVVVSEGQKLIDPTTGKVIYGNETGEKTGGSVSWRNNNPLNIKFGDFSSKYGAVAGTEATDGGVFANFPSVEVGLQAARDLLKSASYRDLPLEQAMRRWSGNGYGADVAPEFTDKTTGSMNDNELNTLIEKMTQREGWEEGDNTDKYVMSILTARLGKSIYGTRISDKESERVEGFVTEGNKQGKSEYEIIDDVLGYRIEKNQDIANVLKDILLQNTGEDGLSGFDMIGLARLINSDNISGAINKVEKMIFAEQGDTEAKDNEAATNFAFNFGEKTIDKIQTNLNKLGIISGNYEKLKKKFVADKNFQSLSSDLTGLISEWRLKMAGSNVTEAELKFLDDLIPTVKDNPFNAIEKIKSFQNMLLGQTNSRRSLYGLPSLDKNTLISMDNRISLYGQKEAQSFEQFIKDKENELQMSIANPEKYRAEFKGGEDNDPLGLGINNDPLNLGI